MKICKIYIKDYLHFKDFELDLNNPHTGEPLEKVCLIGRNGTGKTLFLNLINKFLSGEDIIPLMNKANYSLIIFKVCLESQKFYVTYRSLNQDFILLDEAVEKHFNWTNQLLEGGYSENYVLRHIIKDKSLINKITFRNKFSNLLIHIPSESYQNLSKSINDVPQTNLNEALALFKDFPFNHEISANTIGQFWKLLIFLIKKRQNEWEEFQNQKGNQDKTVRQLKEEFDEKNPKILEKVAELWNKILEKAGLEFDYENASNPIQLNDNLKAYIVLKATKQPIQYNQLSTGIRNFIFQVGHIYSLYFNRKIERGFLLIDEPENSLFPDFQYDLISIYQQIIQNTQLFVATHSPIIAAQFEPYERIILDFDENGWVVSRKGKMPTGDDPNDILIKDFGVRSILGEKGVKKWERYIELQTLIKVEKDKAIKSELLKEYMQIGNEYNFNPNAVS
ncbi:MAG: ATP-binding protein [Thermoflexibacter sp.]|nr:ATP-binding protein [Thermoflexibacter sp.]